MSRPRPRRKGAAEPTRLIAFHKPPGMLSQWSGDPHWPGLSSLLSLPGFYPAGRLDRGSEGLLLLTNDGALQARLTDPAFHLPKTYVALVEGEPGAEALEALRRGVTLTDGPTRPAEARLIPPPDWRPAAEEPPGHWLELTITEGRNRQVRRMGQHIGHKVLRLIRWSIGAQTLAGLAPGETRELTPPEPPLLQPPA
ncbi:pseudouridine synthase [Pararhodobacter aggregans]|uniref:pseudouridine synthase n=1 Tax=Pararhodobacter aggregans TaxID=404875 RepID=UPI003A9384DD